MTDPDQAIGRAKTVLVFGSGPMARAVVSSVVVKHRPRRPRRRMRFRGRVAFAPVARAHLQDTLLPAVDSVAAALGVKRAGFDLSVVNVGAAASRDAGFAIAGFSADAPLFLAMLSAALKMPVRQDVVATGHVASEDGDLRPVSSLPAKLAAAAEDQGIRTFVAPCLDSDASLRELSPSELESAREAIAQAKGRVEVVCASGVHELARACLTDEGIVRAALQIGFYEGELSEADEAKPIARLARWLAQDNESRYWRVMEAALLNGRTALAADLLRHRIRNQTSRKQYPAAFGQRLHDLLASVPRPVRQLKIEFPLVPVGVCLQLSRHMAAADQADLQLLLDAVAGRRVLDQSAGKSGLEGRAGNQEDDAAGGPAEAVLNAVLDEVRPDALARNVGMPIDQARAGYVLRDVTLDSYDAFLQIVQAFYRSLLRHAGLSSLCAAPRQAGDEAMALLGRAFQDTGGLDAA